VEQPLEAARRVLGARPDFLRKDAHLAVIFITDEIDCSLADPTRLDDPSVDASLQCYRAAQRCSGQTEGVISVGGEEGQVSAYASCEDDPAWLVPVETYRQFFSSVKGEDDVGRVILAGITGNPDYGMSPFRDDLGQDPSSVVFAWNETANGQGYLPSCSSSAGTAAPNRRVHELLRAFPNPRTGQPSWVSICNDNFGPALAEIATRIRTELETVCVDIPAGSVEAGADPNTLCVLDELTAGQEPIRSGITADQGWELVPNGTACPPDGLTEPGLVRVEVRIDPALRATFGATSKLAVTCTQ
jgi:hypothetical protein